MPWPTFILTIVSIYAFIKLIRITRSGSRYKFLGLTIAISIFVIMEISILINTLIFANNWGNVIDFIVEWGHVLCLAFVLSSLAIFIRESKPNFAQFPLIYTALPLLIIVSYFLVWDTYALKLWLLAIYQGGALIIALTMYSTYTYLENDYAFSLAGIIIITFSYLLFWFVPGVETHYALIWKLMLALGIAITIIGYERTELELQKDIL